MTHPVTDEAAAPSPTEVPSTQSTQENRKDPRTRIVILGAGIAGLLAAQELHRKKDFLVTIVAPQDTFCFLPRLTEYLARSVPEHKVMLSIPDVWSGDFIKARATAVNPEEKTVLLQTGQSLPYDTLLIAIGSETNTFGIPGALDAYPFYCQRDADKLLDHLANMLSADDAPGIHTVAVVGAGPTGVEVASVLQDAIKKKRPKGSVIVFDRASKPLANLPELSESVASVLAKKGIQFRGNVSVNQITPLSIEITNESGNKETIPCYTTVWAAGSKPVRLAMSGVTLTERGELPLEATLAVKGVSDVYAIGDAAGAGTPKTAQAAVQQAAHVVQNILAARAGKPQKPFAFHYRGTVIALDNDTVGTFFGKRMKGFIARTMRDTYYSFTISQYK